MNLSYKELQAKSFLPKLLTEQIIQRVSDHRGPELPILHHEKIHKWGLHAIKRMTITSKNIKLTYKYSELSLT